MRFNSAFKGLNSGLLTETVTRSF